MEKPGYEAHPTGEPGHEHVYRTRPFVCKPVLFPVLRHQEEPLRILGRFEMVKVAVLRLSEQLLLLKSSLQITIETVWTLFYLAWFW